MLTAKVKLNSLIITELVFSLLLAELSWFHFFHLMFHKRSYEVELLALLPVCKLAKSTRKIK